jgi:hypothetical protein
MTPKDQAKDLISEFLPYVDWSDPLNDFTNRNWAIRNAKRCALIAVDFAMNSKYSFQPMHGGWVSGKSYYEELKQEIESYEE